MNRRQRLRRRRQTAQRRPERLGPQRRGVLLLVVLSMLVLFLLVGTTFLLTSGQYRTASKIVEKAHRTTFQPADLLERALMQLVRDTNNASSVLRYHSLLRDLYGVDGFFARSTVATSIGGVSGGPDLVASPQLVSPHFAGVNATATSLAAPLGPTSGQLVELYVLDADQEPVLHQNDANVVGLDFDRTGLPVNHSLARTDGYYEGCLLTIMSGPCRGSTVRVVDYDYLGDSTVQLSTNASVAYPAPVGRFRIVAPKRVDGQRLNVVNGVVTDLVEGTLGCRFIVNGRPFNGAGVGFNPLALSSPAAEKPLPRLSALETFTFSPSGGSPRYGFEVALLPNSIHFAYESIASLKPDRHYDPFEEGIVHDPAQPNALQGDMVFLNTEGRSPDVERPKPLYPNYAGPGDTDESYDAPDTQNMALAMQALEPRIRGRVVNAAGVSVDPDVYYPNPNTADNVPAGAYLDLEGVTIPSFHRPALANFWFHRLWRSAWLRNLIPDPNGRARAILEPYSANGAPQHGLDADTAAQVVAIKRKFLLRPLREDHPDFDGSNPLSRYATTALRNVLNAGQLVNAKGDADADGNTAGDGDDEITFPLWEAVGPWDVDNDGDGVNDSVWIDIGLPVQQTEDGRWYKPLVAMLVEDLDGRLNLNAHGSEADLAAPIPDVNQPGAFVNDYSNVNGTLSLRANLAMDTANLSAALNDTLNVAPTNYGWLRSSDQLPAGSGWGVAETSLRPILSPTLPLRDALNGTALSGDAQYDDYARLLYGRPDPQAAGRSAAAALRQSVTFGRYGSVGAGPVLTSSNAALYPPTTLTKPGATYVTDPGRISAAPSLASVRDARTPLEYLGYPAYTGALIFGLPEKRSGFSSPPDLRGRLARGLSGAGAPVAEAAAEANAIGATWREMPVNAPDDSPYELDLSIAARNLPPASLEEVVRSYDPDNSGLVEPLTVPLVDDAPFSAAELERILRAFDGDAEKLPDRLWNTVDALDPTKLAAQNQLLAQGADQFTYTPSSLELVVASAQAAVTRRQVTTDSWDLPTPNENLTDRLLLGADGKPGVPEYQTIGDWVPSVTLPANDDGDSGIGVPNVDDDGDGTIDEVDEVPLVDEGDEVVASYNGAGSHTFSDGTARTYQDLFDAGCDDYVVVMWQDPPAAARLTDYLKYRITLEMLRKGVLAYPPRGMSAAQIRDYLQQTYHPQVNRYAEQILFGRALATTDTTRYTDLYSFGGLLAPEVLAGRRMDLNRPFGDGRDNNGNGVVDEPQEAGEPYMYRLAGAAVQYSAFFDLDKSGAFEQDVNGDNLLYVDGDGDGRPDRFQAADIADPDGDGVREPIVDNLWIDSNEDGVRNADEFRPLDYVRGADVNGRGVTNGTDTVRDDDRLARQLFARHLYCLMLALVDENYLAPYDSDDPQVLHYLDPLSGTVADKTISAESGEAFRIANDLHAIEFGLVPPATPVPGVTPNHTVSFINNPNIDDASEQALEIRRLTLLNRARQIAQRKLTCRKIAQWAVNVVDFRDPDAIQTEFEYDENPWNGWNVVDTLNGVVYPIDGDLTTDENLTQHRVINAAGLTAPQLARRDMTNPSSPRISSEEARRWVPRKDWTRGVVWGAERPEVLLTEGVAWHDRRLEDLASEDKNDNNNPVDGGQISGTPGNNDDDLDQLRKPKGNLFLETYNPHIGDDQQPAELYTHVNRNGQVTASPGVRLDRLSNGFVVDQTNPANPRNLRSPVWRIAVVEEHPLIRNATAGGASGAALGTSSAGQASDDPVTTTVQQYLQQSVAWGPWVYAADANLSTQLPGLNIPLLQHAYLEYHKDKKTEAGFALLTEFDLAAGNRLNDADGVGIATGVIERAPTVPDTSFPAFDRFAQPYNPQTKTLSLSSKADARGTGSFVRGILTKPTTYIERLFYMTPADAAPKPGTVGPSIPGSILPTANLINPGLRVPLLTYEVSSNYTDGTRLGQEGPQVGVQEGSGSGVFGSPGYSKTVRVHVSKFAAAYDRLDLDRDGNLTETYEEMLAANPNAPVGFAPLLPGRRGVIGTTGAVYKVDDTTVTPDPSDLANPFDGAVAMRLAGRYASVISQKETPGTSASSGIIDAPNVGSAGADLRRFEMIPNPNPNRHQFAIRMNGLNESLSILQDTDSLSGDPNVEGAGSDGKSDAFNLTGGEATGQADATLSAAPPVIAIPIDHFSISEPLDEYLVRQIELDSALSHYPQPSYLIRTNSGAPKEDYFARTGGEGDNYHFDEPFDISPELVENQTTPNYRSVHLERLANPLLPWNPAPVRPDGQAIAQHDPALPVNPYLPVDARALDLTSFNSYTDLEKNLAARGTAPVPSEFVNGVGANPRGPEERHRAKRSLEDLLSKEDPPQNRTVLGFASNERGRPLGPFPLLWMMEPTRLLWRQSGGSTISEIAHTYASTTYNGYLAKAGDQIAKPQAGGGGIPGPGERLGMEGTLYDSLQIDDTPYDYDMSTTYNKNQYVDVAWRLTLGFADWMWGETHSGSGLLWFNDAGPDLAAERIDLDGDGAPGDLANRPEMNTVPNTQTLAANGRPMSVNGASFVGTNARDFMRSYLQTQAAEQSTTPEFVWPNRPFASAGELLQVPVWGGSRMLTYFSVFNWQYTQNPHFSRRTQVNPYDGEAQIYHDGLDFVPDTFNTAAPSFDGDFSNDNPATDVVTDITGVRRPQAGATNVVRFRDMLGHFGHLMNFFQTARFPSIATSYAYQDVNGNQVEAAVPRGASHFYRLLDYVCVPSRYTATDMLLNADAFAGTFGDAATVAADPRRELAAPFNRIDYYREPGRVNLNTIVGRRDAAEATAAPRLDPTPLANGAGPNDNGYDAARSTPRLPDYWSEVYDGLMHRVQDGSLIEYGSGSLLRQGHLGPAWRDVALSRRGYVQPGFDPTINPVGSVETLGAPRQNQVDYSPMRMHPDFPTLFANPFRAPGEGANVPLANMVQTGVDATMLRAHPLSPGADGAWGRRGVDDFVVDKDAVANTNFASGNLNRDDAAEAGVLTMSLGGAATGGNILDRLSADVVLSRIDRSTLRRGALPDTFLDSAFVNLSTDTDPAATFPTQPRDVTPQQSRAFSIANSEISKRSTAVPLFSGASLEPSLDTERNASKRYEPIQRMSNLATTRSNVYAVWITVGFFEVKPAREDPRVWTRYMVDSNGDGVVDGFRGSTAAEQAAMQDLFFRVYPEGWMLGEEIGRDTGEDVRHRGFYIVDRSRPVAFKPGEDANVSDTVILRRRVQ